MNIFSRFKKKNEMYLALRPRKSEPNLMIFAFLVEIQN